jgi:hypothetical protein
MAYGLQIWDDQSRLLLDNSDRITRLLATYSGTVYYNSSQLDWYWTISIPGFINDNHSYILVNMTNSDSSRDWYSRAWCSSSETLTIYYLNYYSSGSINYTIKLMGF